MERLKKVAIKAFTFQVQAKGSRNLRVGIISDTHGYLDPTILILFRGCDRILHLGDIGVPDILMELKKVAPITAIRGNHEPAGLIHLPMLRFLKLEGVKIALSHGLSSMDRDVARAMFSQYFEGLKAKQIKIVLFGHTHHAEAYEQDGIVFLNPGYAGAPSPAQPRSVAILHLNKSGEWAFELMPLQNFC